MPERGPVQLLLLSLRILARSWSRVALAAILLALLGFLPREEGVYHHVTSELSQSLRQAAWNHAVAGDQVEPAWPWEQTAPVTYSRVPRLGLSATVQHAQSDASAMPQFKSSPHIASEDRRDPHLLPNDGDFTADDADLTGQDLISRLRNLGCPATGSEAGARDPHLPCPRANLSLTDALRLIIRSGKLDKLESQATSDEQKL